MKHNANMFKPFFQLDPDITYLNFGSFGACPTPVFDDLIHWQRLLEREPVQYFDDNVVGYLKNSREALGQYIGCDHDDVVYVPNPTYAINLLAGNVDLKIGDEILTTDLEYGAMDYTWEHYCEKSQAKYVRQPIRFPLESKEDFIEQFWKGYTDRTRFIFISHITSATALILPVKEICDEAKRRGLITIVDGAHVPGHIPLNIRELNPDYYTGACHKWMMTAKGSSFLYVKKNLQPLSNPIVISWGFRKSHPLNNTFLNYHQLNGTRDYAAPLTIPAAIAFMEKWNWNEVSASCKSMVREHATRFCKLAKSVPLAPVNEDFTGQMFSIPVSINDPVILKKKLFNDYKIEIPVTVKDSEYFVRYSINAFNSEDDLDRLYKALETELS